MTNPVMVVRRTTHNGKSIGRGCWVWCPGCDTAHRFQIIGEDGSEPEGPKWEWDGNLEQPTFGPSYLTWSGNRDNPEPGDTRCHSFLRGGIWEFLSDSTHELAGQKVPMVPLPDWLVR